MATGILGPTGPQVQVPDEFPEFLDPADRAEYEAWCQSGHPASTPPRNPVMGRKLTMADCVIPEGSLFSAVLDMSFRTQNGRRQTYLKCRCRCGSEGWFQRYYVVTGHTRSCGCATGELSSEHSRTHGLSKSRAWVTWSGIRGRCNNPNNDKYKWYGARGIKVAAEWNNSFDAFYAHLKTLLPSGCVDIPKGFEIDRIDNDGDYAPGNIRLATRKQQSRNTRANVVLEVDGVSKCIAEWAEETGISAVAIYQRISVLGWDAKRAVLTPIRSRRLDALDAERDAADAAAEAADARQAEEAMHAAADAGEGEPW